MKQLALIAVMMATGMVYAADMPKLEFKGIYPGMSIEEMQDGRDLSCKNENGGNSPFDFSCYFKYNETIAGVTAKFILIGALNGKVKYISIFFGESGFVQVKTALIEKYGKGKTSVEIVHNAMGAKYKNESIKWTQPPSTMQIFQRYGEINQSAMILDSIQAGDISDHAKRLKNQTHKNAKDL